MTCNHLKIPKRYRNLLKWWLLWIGSYLGQQTSVGLSSFCCTNGKNLSGPRSVLWHSSNLNNIYLTRPLCPAPWWMKFFFAYIAVAFYAIRFVLIWVDSGIQRPIYYVSKSLNEAEVRYLPLEKAILAVVYATRKLPLYFQGVWSCSLNFHSS